MPLPASLEAAVNAIKILRRDATRAGGIEGDLLAFVNIGVAGASKHDFLVVALYSDVSPRLDMAPGVVDLGRKDTYR